MFRWIAKWCLACVLFGMWGCPQPPPLVGRAGSPCVGNGDCILSLECRARRCRTPLSNSRPVAVIEVDPPEGAAIAVGDEVSLDGHKSRDGDLDPLNYHWQLSGPSTSRSRLSDAKARRTRFVPDVPGLYRVELSVDDGKQKSTPVSLSLQVGRPPKGNRPPKAYAGADQYVAPGTRLTLDGSKSSDPDGDQLAYRWSLLGKPEGSEAFLYRPLDVAPSITVDLEGSYQISLEVVDAHGLRSSDTLWIRVVGQGPFKPSIRSITPASIPAGSGSFKLLVRGERFVKGAVVVVAGREFGAQVLSGEELVAYPALSQLSPGTYSVEVRTPNGLRSNALPFNVSSGSGPILNVLKPDRGRLGEVVQLRAYGRGFAKGASLLFAGAKVPTRFVSESVLEGSLDLKGAKPGKSWISVQNPDGSASLKQTFLVEALHPTPILNWIAPSTLPLGTKTSFAALGEFFVPGHSKFYIGGVEIPITKATSQRLDLVFGGAGSLHLGAHPAWVTNPGPTGPLKSKVFTVEIVAGAPSLTGVKPWIWAVGCDIDVELVGSQFSGKSVVYFGQLVFEQNPKDPKQKLTLLNSTRMRFRLQTSKLKPGTHSIAVANSPGSRSNVLGFSLLSSSPTPGIKAVSPSQAVANSSVSLKLTAEPQKPFLPSAQVEFNGKLLTTSCQQLSADGKSCLELAASLDLRGVAPGNARLVVLHPCNSRSAAVSFGVQAPPPPQIRSAAGVVRGGPRQLKLVGAHFAKGDVLIVDGLRSKPIAGAVASPTSFEATVPLDFVKYATTVELYILRCHDPQCSKSSQSNTYLLSVLETPNCTAYDCAKAMLPAGSEGCTAYNGQLACRPKCAQDSDCTSARGAPSNASCVAGFCK